MLKENENSVDSSGIAMLHSEVGAFLMDNFKIVSMTDPEAQDGCTVFAPEGIARPKGVVIGQEAQVQVVVGGFVEMSLTDLHGHAVNPKASEYSREVYSAMLTTAQDAVIDFYFAPDDV